MANRDAKLIERVLKDFSLNFKSGDGGGTKVVTELPQVGEEHIIYELQEKKKVPSLIPRYNKQMIDDKVLNELSLYVFVFDTSEDMTNTLNPIIPDEEIPFCLSYIIKEDKLIMSIYGGTKWQFGEATKVSDYKFDLSNGSETEHMYLVILKEYLGKSSEEGEAVKYAGKLLNNELYTFEPNTFGVLLGSPTTGVMILNTCVEGFEIPEDTPKELIFEYIPYEKIINNPSMYEMWVFKPNGTGEGIASSYWIYTNETWFNADEIRKFETQEKTVSPNTNTQPITPDEGYDGLSKVTVNAIKLQDKTVSPTASMQHVTADANYNGLRLVTVNAVNLQFKTVSPTTSKQYVNPDTNFTGLRQVEVSAVTSAIDSNIKAENIKKGIAILGVTGTHEGDGAIYTISTLTSALPQTMYGMGVARVGSNVYLFGGNGPVNTIYKFNTKTETIAALSATLPSVLEDMGVAQVGSYIYLFGGYDNSKNNGGYVNTIYKFDAETETISTLSTALQNRVSNMGVAQVGSNIYLFGGTNYSYGLSYLNTIYKFNTETETITTLSATLPRALADMGVAQVGSDIYLFGGGYSNGSVNTVYKFNTETETITTLSATLPSSLRYIRASSIGGNVYLFGGGYSGNSVNTIYKFNTETETITTLSETLPERMGRMGVDSVGSNAYLFGGYGNSGPKNTIYKFKVDF